MNETIAVTIWIVATVAFIVTVVRWFLKEERDSDYIKTERFIFDDFYSLGKRSKD